MKYIFIAASLMLSNNVFAAFKINPGLWEIDTNIKINGKVQPSPLDQINKLPNEQKEKILKLMKIKPGTKPNSQRMCLTDDQISQLTNMATGKKSNDDFCQHSITSQSTSLYSASYNCKDGTTGIVNSTKKNSNSIHTISYGKDKEGNTYEFDSTATYVKSSCE